MIEGRVKKSERTFLGGSVIKLYSNIPNLAIVTVINLLPLNSKFTSSLLCDTETEPCKRFFASKHTISTAHILDGHYRGEGLLV